jgi:hypothetical protein
MKDHHSICRFTTPDDPDYKLICQAITGWVTDPDIEVLRAVSSSGTHRLSSSDHRGTFSHVFDHGSMLTNKHFIVKFRLPLALLLGENKTYMRSNALLYMQA